jgi:hypothetical protein
MGLDDFLVKEKKTNVLFDFFLRNTELLADIQIEQIKETLTRYSDDNWRMRVYYEGDNWIFAAAYEFERDAQVLNIGLQAVDYVPQRSVNFPALYVMNSIFHEQRFRLTGNMPPKFCDFELWRGSQFADVQNAYDFVTQLKSPTSYIRRARVPFSLVKPDLV